MIKTLEKQINANVHDITQMRNKYEQILGKGRSQTMNRGCECRSVVEQHA